MSNKTFLQVALAKDNILMSLALFSVFIIAGLYTLLGVGMSMSSLEMTRMSGVFSLPSASSSMHGNMEMGQMDDMEMGNEHAKNSMHSEKNQVRNNTDIPTMNKPVDMSMVDEAWSIKHSAMMFLMWFFMMIAMMVPSASPVLLLFFQLKKMGQQAEKAVAYTYLFLLGYLISWGIFSGIACAMQLFLENANLANAMMMQLKSPEMAGALVISAGIYQFTPLKQACLKHCRSPAEFLARSNRKGATGACFTGIHHGMYCLGCCWALMALLFVGGVMNLYWIVGLAIYVIIEKASAFIRWIDKLSGALLVLGGFVLLVT